MKNLPTFHFYSGAAGRVEDFNAGPARAHVIREKVVEYALGSCPLSSPDGAGEDDAASALAEPAAASTGWGSSAPSGDPPSSVGGTAGWGSG